VPADGVVLCSLELQHAVSEADHQSLDGPQRRSRRRFAYFISKRLRFHHGYGLSRLDVITKRSFAAFFFGVSRSGR
jgi:hypothetical protein